MNQIAFRGSCVLGRACLWRNPVSVWRRNYPKDGKEKDEEAKENVNVRKGVLHAKQQSIQEESYFHREEMEQLKGLKKKLKKEKEDKKLDTK